MAPPRTVLAAKATTVARGGAGPAKKALVPALVTRSYSQDIVRQPDVKETCPLCVEDLDETDKDFYPCPCGYQVCLFCYEKVKEKCNALCPGCRREYGAPVEAPAVTKSEDRSLEASRSSSGVLTLPRPMVVSGYPSSSLHSASSAPPPLQAGRTTAAASKPSDVLAAQQRRALEGQQAAGRRPDAAGAALPTGATWAAPSGQAAPRHASGIGDPDQRQPVASSSVATPVVDTSAWPSLAAAAAAPAMQRQQEKQQHHQHNHQRQDYSQGSADTPSSVTSQHHRSASGSSASADGMHSRTSSSQDLSSQDIPSHHPQVSTATSTSSQVPLHLAEVFATAQVSSMVHGVRHNISVPLTGHVSQAHMLPEAPALKSSLQEAVKTGTVCSKEAAARLLALLRHNTQADSPALPHPVAVPVGVGMPVGGPVRSQLAAGRPPPGFGPAALQGQPVSLPPALQHLGGSLSLHLNNNDPSIIRPPLGKFQPIQPPLQGNGLLFGATTAAPARPIQPPGIVAQPAASTSAAPAIPQPQPQQQQQLGNGTYSLWSGLPGLEIGGGPQVGWQGPPGFQPGAGLQMGGLGALPFPIASTSAAATMPPPGFGPTPSAAVSRPPGFGGPSTATLGNAAAGSTTDSGSSSLLQSQLAGLSRPPPPGMAAYRPSLG